MKGEFKCHQLLKKSGDILTTAQVAYSGKGQKNIAAISLANNQIQLYSLPSSAKRSQYHQGISLLPQAKYLNKFGFSLSLSK